LKSYYDELTSYTEGYVMRNLSSGVEINCTEKFLKAWEQRGFVIIKKSLIKLIEEK